MLQTQTPQRLGDVSKSLFDKSMSGLATKQCGNKKSGESIGIPMSLYDATHTHTHMQGTICGMCNLSEYYEFPNVNSDANVMYVIVVTQARGLSSDVAAGHY